VLKHLCCRVDRTFLCLVCLILSALPVAANESLAYVQNHGHLTGTPKDRPVIRFAPLPMASLEQVTLEYLPFIDFLEKETGYAFELAWHENYEALIESIASGQVDIAYLGPLPYVAVTQKSQHIIPVVQLLDSKGRSDYTCAIVHFADSGASLNPNHHYDVALTQPLSTCGYLATEDYLQRQGMSLEDGAFSYDYTGSHERVALDVILGKYQFGGMKTQIARRYHHLGLRIIDETQPVPGFVLVANSSTLAPEFIEQVRDAMLRLAPQDNKAHQKMMQTWSRNLRYGAKPVTDAAYDVIRQQWYQLKVNLIGAAK